MAGRRSSFPSLSSSEAPDSAPSHPSTQQPRPAILQSSEILPPTAFSSSVPNLVNGIATESNAPRLPPDNQASTHHHPTPFDADGSRSNLSQNLSQQQLNEYRETMARDLEQRELSSRIHCDGPLDTKVRTSPVLGAAATPTSSCLINAAFTTTSTESGHTVRGGMTSVPVASTPSYPFPRMPMPPGVFSSSQPYQSPNPTSASLMRNAQAAPFQYRGVLDGVLSNGSTPASAFTFNPIGTPQPEAQAFPTPNLYDLTLTLSSEPGLDNWWKAVVQIMRDVFKAERVTLAVPADATDIENVPWGQKATYNEHEEDVLSLGYMESGSQTVESRISEEAGNATIPPDDDRPDSRDRPDLSGRHSFTALEENKEQETALADTNSETVPRRPPGLMKSKTQLPLIRAATATLANDHARLSHDTLEQLRSSQEEKEHRLPRWEAPFAAHRGTQARVLRILQALTYEADPLIDHSGVTRVLERGRTVALTRTYPYLAPTEAADQAASSSTSHLPNTRSDSLSKARSQRADSISKLSCIFAGPTSPRGSIRGKAHVGDRIKNLASAADDEDLNAPIPRYEEYEQAPPSPWSQSPAPSPAVRPDPKDNPFFTDAVVDEDCFNPGPAPADYSGMCPPEAIGVDHSWTVLHIPLSHAFVPKAKAAFKLNPTVLQRKSNREHEQEAGNEAAASRQQNDEGAATQDRRAPPIAILSILSPVIPYPANLRQSLDQLAPHLANSFALARHYTNLETELAGLRRRRPQTVGFGAVSPSGRPLESASFLPGAGEAALPHSLAGSMTSPSDYSTLSRSIAGSPSGTPGWESLAQVIERRQTAGSPAAMSQGSGSYFSSKQTRHPSWAVPGCFRPRAGSRDHSIGEKRPSILYAIKDSKYEDVADDGFVYHYSRGLDDPSLKGKSDQKPEGACDKAVDAGLDAAPTDQAQTKRGHTMLHSYGADFSSTFQLLPPASALPSKAATSSGPSASRRSGSFSSNTAEMPPPSDRLKGLILDSLPAHVFVALPQTGEVVWVNSRYLSYRGQSVADLSADPWSSIHPEDVDEYLEDWGRSLRTGEQFSRIVRIKRFDGAFRWFFARAVASKDKRGVIVNFLGSYMDVHDQRVAELKFARQEEIEASESKHRLLANLIPQIIFTATETDGITFANQQWLSYTGQKYEDALRLGFMDFVHPEDMCRIPSFRSTSRNDRSGSRPDGAGSPASSQGNATPTGDEADAQASSSYHHGLGNTSGSAILEFAGADLAELARRGLLKEVIDSEGRPSYATEARLRSKTGEYRWHLIRCVEIDTIDFGSGASSYFGSATDINDHKLLEAKLKEAMDSKSRFLSNMSHEIRTPLIGISGMVSFLQDSTLNEEQRDFTNTIQTSANSLLMIINDILDLSKVDAGMMKLNHEWFHTRSLIEDVNELVSTMAIAKRLELNYLVEADVPAWVKGDKVRIRQVLLNVIGNAIKFTAEGEVFSRCRVYPPPDGMLASNEIMLEFSIIDTGRGFSEEERRLIFKPFSQIDGSSTRQHGGSGLGLVISRQLVELHGGRMEGTAVVGKGSTFTFTAKFILPTMEDRPANFDRFRSLPTAAATHPTGAAAFQPTVVVEHLAPGKPSAKTLPIVDGIGQVAADTEFKSPGVTWTGSSNPSDASVQSQTTNASSIATMNTGSTRFSEAAKASGQDLCDNVRPPMYSILIICPQYHSREATTQHIETTLSKDVPHQIKAVGSVQEAERYIGGSEPVRFTHIVINISSAEAIVDALDMITRSQKMESTRILILSDTIQRQAVLRLADETKFKRLMSDKLVTFIYKPVKPSRFAVIFDPDKVRDLSTDWNRSTAQQMVENEKASYLEIERRMGHRGLKVLLVEDNPVNQKVLTKFMTKIGVEVEIAVDGMECTERVLAKPHDYYSLILCDLHMPRKDGYQACREIRGREMTVNASRMPIIALSANVMSDVQEKCFAAGFSDYITKPVDFIELSRAMSRFF